MSKAFPNQSDLISAITREVIDALGINGAIERAVQQITQNDALVLVYRADLRKVTPILEAHRTDPRSVYPIIDRLIAAGDNGSPEVANMIYSMGFAREIDRLPVK